MWSWGVLGIAHAMEWFGVNEETDVVVEADPNGSPQRPLTLEKLPPPRLPVARKLIVLDVDDTILHKVSSSVDIDAVPLKRGAEAFLDLPFMKWFCEECFAAGHELRIASYGEDVESLLAAFDDGLGPGREYLCDAPHFACWQGSNGKMDHIEYLREVAAEYGNGAFEWKQIILIDDNAHNTQLAKQRYHGFCCENGFTSAWFAKEKELQRLLHVYPPHSTAK